MKSFLPLKPMLTIIFLSLLIGMAGAQQRADRMLQVLDTATIEAQFQYIHDRTLIYENFRAIQEDVFQKMRKNALDTLSLAEEEIHELGNSLVNSRDRIDSLQTQLSRLDDELEIAVKNRNNISVLGFNTNKLLYNTIVWSVIIGLAGLLVALLLAYRRNLSISRKLRKERNETSEEYESYKKTARERYEKLVVSHHNEIKKLKGR